MHSRSGSGVIPLEEWKKEEVWIGRNIKRPDMNSSPSEVDIWLRKTTATALAPPSSRENKSNKELSWNRIQGSPASSVSS